MTIQHLGTLANQTLIHFRCCEIGCIINFSRAAALLQLFSNWSRHYRSIYWRGQLMLARWQQQMTMIERQRICRVNCASWTTRIRIGRRIWFRPAKWAETIAFDERQTCPASIDGRVFFFFLLGQSCQRNLEVLSRVASDHWTIPRWNWNIGTVPSNCVFQWTASTWKVKEKPNVWKCIGRNCHFRLALS